jgi:hypothetical protein
MEGIVVLEESGLRKEEAEVCYVSTFARLWDRRSFILHIAF